MNIKESIYEKGLVSVIIPTYKRSEKLNRAIDSVLNQTYKNLEVLLVNDNEPNDEYTEEVKRRIQRYQNDNRFHLIIQDKHINGAVARNVGIKQARGEYIAFLDDDDWWELNKLEMQVHELSKLDKEWGGVSCRIRRYLGNKLVAEQPKYNDGFVYKDVLMLLADYETGTLLLRHKCLDETGFFDERLIRHQDLQLLIDFTHIYKLKQLDAFLHCRDISDTLNRPNIEKIISAKQAFFKSIEPLMQSLSTSEQNQIMALHRAEVGYVRLKNKDILRGLVDFLPLLFSRRAMKCEIKRVKEKIDSRR